MSLNVVNDMSLLFHFSSLYIVPIRYASTLTYSYIHIHCRCYTLTRASTKLLAYPYTSCSNTKGLIMITFKSFSDYESPQWSLYHVSGTMLFVMSLFAGTVGTVGSSRINKLNVQVDSSIGSIDQCLHLL